MLADNVYELVNLMDENGDLMFTDRQAVRMERALATFEFSYGQGDPQRPVGRGRCAADHGGCTPEEMSRS